MAVFAAAPFSGQLDVSAQTITDTVLGPALGPIVSGFIHNAGVSWRWQVWPCFPRPHLNLSQGLLDWRLCVRSTHINMSDIPKACAGFACSGSSSSFRKRTRLSS
jgi:hypothetical protein